MFSKGERDVHPRGIKRSPWGDMALAPCPKEAAAASRQYHLAAIDNVKAGGGIGDAASMKVEVARGALRCQYFEQ